MQLILTISILVSSELSSPKIQLQNTRTVVIPKALIRPRSTVVILRLQRSDVGDSGYVDLYSEARYLHKFSSQCLTVNSDPPITTTSKRTSCQEGKVGVGAGGRALQDSELIHFLRDI